MKAKTLCYWICTILIALAFIPGGVFYVLGMSQAVEGVMRLGFPRYFVTFLGVWKVLGGIAVLVPGFARIKEWAYAGMFFDLTGAACAAAVAGSVWHFIAPLAVAVILAASWALRPPSRTLGLVLPVKTAGLR